MSTLDLLPHSMPILSPKTTPYKQIKPSTRVSIKSWKQGRVLNLDNDDNDHLITGGDEDGRGEGGGIRGEG